MTLRTTPPVFLTAGALVFASLSGLADSTRPAPPAHTPSVNPWIGEPATSARALVLVAHGLNLRPSRMEALAREICDEGSGLACRWITLPGHADPGSAGDEDFERLLRSSPDSGQAVADAWKKTMLSELQATRALAGQRPVYFLGYSLGALVGLWAERVAGAVAGAAGQDPPGPFSKMMLLAPPVETHFYTRLAAWIPGPGHWRIPSRNHPEYRVHGATTLAAYRAMQALQSEVGQSFHKNLDGPNTLVLVNPRDELVDAEDLRTLIQREGRWTGALIEDIGPIEPTLSPAYQHLFIDEPSMGTRAWDGLRSRIRQFFVTAD